MGTRAARLTDRQREALAVFARSPHRWITPDQLAAALSTSRHGASSTAASLVGRGRLVRRVTRGRVSWRAS